MKSGDRLDQIESLIAEISSRLDKMDESLDKIAGLLGEIVEKLDEITERLDPKTDQIGEKMGTNSDEIKRRLVENEKSKEEIKSILNYLKNKN
jgi:methyl-accepting chemotaxis protein